MEILIERASVTLGFLTLAAALSTFASCRSCISFLKWFRIQNPLSNKAYRAFYQFHSYYWWAFVSLLVIHLSLAIAHTGIPKAGDPDAPVHWYILSFGFGSALFTFFTLSSCRISNDFISGLFKNENQLQAGYKKFKGYHAYLWLIFLLVFAVHFFFAHQHVGFWPMPGM